MIRKSRTVLKCNNCDPSYELGERNQKWRNRGKMVEYCKSYVGIQIYSNAPKDYNDKLDKLICPFCDNKLIDTELSVDDFHLIGKASDWNREVLDLMIELHKNNLIEYQLKINQFKIQQEQTNKLEEEQREKSGPHCPHCQSTNIKSISGLNRGASIAMWGIFSKKINKSFECKNCGYTW